jgi:hypothetical protein
MDREKIFHDWLIYYVKEKLSHDYSEILINVEGEAHNEFNGHYPDLILSSYGLVMGIIEVETESTLTLENAQKWKKLLHQGARLIIIVPERSKAHITDILWQVGIAQYVSIGTYDIRLSMP